MIRWLTELKILLIGDSCSKGDSRSIGLAGEHAALRYLKKLGWRCVGKNVRFGKDELDILVISPDELTMAIVEVRSTASEGKAPERTIGRSKRAAMIRVAKQVQPIAMRNNCSLRVDVITVCFGTKKPTIEHFEGVLPLEKSRSFS